MLRADEFDRLDSHCGRVAGQFWDFHRLKTPSDHGMVDVALEFGGLWQLGALGSAPFPDQPSRSPKNRRLPANVVGSADRRPKCDGLGMNRGAGMTEACLKTPQRVGKDRGAGTVARDPPGKLVGGG